MLTPRNLARCQVGQCKYAFITDEQGGIINDPVLLRLGENHFWLWQGASACWSPRLEKNVGFAMLPAELSEIGTEIEVHRPEATVDAIVADRVFFRPEHAEQQLRHGDS